MTVNVDKCAVMSTSHSRDKLEYAYRIEYEELERDSTKKDLGVLMDDKLSFTQHVDDITRKSYKMLGFIFRCGKYFKTQRSMSLLFNSLVRNHLEYCSSVWSPYYVNAIDQLERVQRKFTRLFYYKFNLGNPRPEYRHRLKYLKIHTLESRRNENDEIMLLKLVNNHVDSSLRNCLTYNHPQRSTRQNSTFYLPTMFSSLFRIFLKCM